MTPEAALFGDRLAPDGTLVRENFAAWFGSSVMRDAHGLPRVLYHGTRVDFDCFQAGPYGIFFAQDLKQADSFSRISSRKGSGRILPVFLRIERPWTLISYADDVPYSRMVDQSTATLIALGYDGMHRPGDGAWIVFSPSQIKSAIGNSGLFSRESNDIADQVFRMEHADLCIEDAALRITDTASCIEGAEICISEAADADAPVERMRA